MKREVRWLVAASVALASSVAFAGPAKGPKAKLIQRGEYLVKFGGCNDCHTPWSFDPQIGAPKPDMSRMLSGHPEKAPDPAGAYTKPDMAVIGPTFTSFNLPFGTVYAANLTPDKDTGLGSWTEQMFIKAMRTGRHMGGEKTARPILPPMPWQNLQGLTDEDLKSIFAYLQSIPAIKNAVPDPKVPPQVIEGMMKGMEKAESMAKGQQGGAK